MLDSQVLAFTIVAAVLTVTPGADTLLVVRNTLRGGVRDGLATMAGVCCGLYAHALLSALGLSVILTQSAAAFTALKIAGAGYLVWLGAQSLLAARRGHPVPAAAIAGIRVSAARSFREGFLTNVLNPKVAVFYLALLPQFIGPGDPVLAKSLLLTAIHFAQGLLWLGGVVLLVNRSRTFFLRTAIRRWMDAACGALLVALGLRLAMERP